VTVAGIIPAMDKLDKHLRNTAQDEELHPAIQAAMKLARNKMDKYWKKTDDSNVYRIAMGTTSFFFLGPTGLPQHFSPPTQLEAIVLPPAKLG
jgi:hypothetical protein